MQYFIYYFWTFIIGAFAGVVIETIWCLIKNKKLESRKGLIYGPFNPLYGVATGALSFTINHLTNQTTGNVFIVGVVISSIIEYLCSYYQEKVLGTVSWNYKDFKFNLNGRINLVYSLIWGILTVFWFKDLMPILDKILPYFYNHTLLTVFAFIFIIIDCIISILANVRRKQRKENIYAHTKLEKHFDYFYTDELLEKIYPNSEFTEK